MKIYISVLSVCMIALSFSMGVSAEEQPSKGYAELFKVDEGQTPASVAAEFLGSEDYADELLKFNGLRPAEFGKAHGGYIAIPGEYFKRALTTLDAAQQAMEEAVVAQSEEYSPIQFQYARSLIQLSEAAYDEAAFDKTRHLAEQALDEALIARDLANQKAVVAVPVKVMKSHGDVSLAGDQAGEQPLGSTQALAEGATLQTGNGRILLGFSDGSQILLFEDTRLSIKQSEMDERFGIYWKHLVLHSGVAEVSAAKAATDNSEFLINLGGMEMEMADSRSCISGFEGRFALSVFEGTVSRIDEEQLLRLSAGRGLVLDAQADLQSSQEVDTQPSLLSPAPNTTTAIQKPKFELAAIPTSGTSVLLEIAKAEDFVETVYVGLSEEAHIPTSLLAEGKYFWRARNNSNGLLGKPSAAASLHIIQNLEVNLTFEPAPLQIDDRSVISGRTAIFASPRHEDTSVMGYEFQMGESPFTYHAAPFSVPHHGPVTVKVKGVSADGAYGQTEALEIFLDSEPPQAKVTVETEAIDEGAASRVTLTINAEDESGVRIIRYRIADGALLDYKEAVTFDVESDVDVFYEAEDALGNVSRLRRVRVFTEME